MVSKKECPIRHVIIEDKNEVWFVGCSATAMGLNVIISKYFPGYTGKLATQEYFEQLLEKHGAN